MPCLVGHIDADLALKKLLLKFLDELVHDVEDDFPRDAVEPDNAVETVAELGSEEALDLNHCPALVRVAALILRKADGVLHGLPDACVGGHDYDRLGEVNLPPAAVEQRSVVEHLEHEVEDGLIRLLNLIEHNYGVRLLQDLVRQRAALAETGVRGLRADELGR